MNQPNYIAIDDIVANADQPRQTFDDASLAELAESIREHGILQPLIVVENTDEATSHYPYALIAGERRLRAAKIAGLSEVPCIVRNVIPDAQTELELALIENIQREDLSPADEARAYQRLHDEFKLTDEQIGQRVGKAAATIRGTRRLAELPSDVLDLIGDGAGQLRVRDARRLIPISRLIKADVLVRSAVTIARLDPDERRAIDGRVLSRLIAGNPQHVIMPDNLWDFTWPTKPIDLGDGQDVRIIPACTKCDLYLKLHGEYGGMEHHCLNKACHTVKEKVFADHELKRASKALGIPAVAEGEKAVILTIGHNFIDKVRRWVANPPDHLRLSTNATQKRNDAYYHHDLTGSRMVYLASTDPDALAEEAAKGKAARLQRGKNARKEQKEADRKERLAHWKVLGQQRKALADANWLVVDTASKLAHKVPLTGLWLEMFAKYIKYIVDIRFDSASIRLDEIEKELHKSTKTAEREALLRENVLLYMICDGAPDESDWPGVKKHVTEFITGKPEKNGAGGLGIKYTIPEPPIQRTESNCWTCGAYAPYDELKQDQIDAGWSSIWQGHKCLDMKCPDCTNKANKSVKAKPAANNGAK